MENNQNAQNDGNRAYPLKAFRGSALRYHLTHLLKNGYYSQFVFFVHMHIIVIIRVNS